METIRACAVPPGENLSLRRTLALILNPTFAGGKDLNADLQQLHRKHGQDHILLEISFPTDYPTHPFTLRIVSPRCKCDPASQQQCAAHGCQLRQTRALTHTV